MTNWTDATTPHKPICPGCGETDLIERINREWYCAVCSRAWPEMSPKSQATTETVQTVGIFTVLPR